MSLIHLEKSILTFHFKEILEAPEQTHPLTLLGLGVLLFGSQRLTAHQAAARVDHSPSPSAYGQTAIPLRQWVATAHKREVTKQLHTLVHPHTASEQIVMPPASRS